MIQGNSLVAFSLVAFCIAPEITTGWIALQIWAREPSRDYVSKQVAGNNIVSCV